MLSGYGLGHVPGFENGDPNSRFQYASDRREKTRTMHFPNKTTG